MTASSSRNYVVADDHAAAGRRRGDARPRSRRRASAGTAWMWSQWPWVSRTSRTSRRLAQVEQPLVLVGGVEQDGVAGLLAAEHEDVVVHRPDDDLVDLDLGVVVVERHAPSLPSPAVRSLCAARPARSGTSAEARARPEGVRRRRPRTRGRGRRGSGGRRRWRSVTGRGQAVGGGEVDGVDGAQRMRARRAPRPGSRHTASTGTTASRSQSVAQRPAQRRRCSAASSLSRSASTSASVRASADAHQSASAAIAASDHVAAGAVDVAGHERGGVEEQRHRQRTASSSRSRRKPAQTGTATSGRRPVGPAGAAHQAPGGQVVEGDGARRRARAGPSWATGRPSTVMTMRSPAAARRTADAVALRSSRIPSRSIARLDCSTGVHTPIRRRIGAR